MPENARMCSFFNIRGRKTHVVLSDDCLELLYDGIKAKSTKIPISEVIAITPKHLTADRAEEAHPPGPCHPHASPDSLRERGKFIHEFVLHYACRIGSYRWREKTVRFHHSDPFVIRRWSQAIQDLIDTLSNRPRSLLVFINPFGGRKKGVPIYAKTVAPLFALAGMQCEVIETEYANHAKTLLQTKDISRFDGIVSVGGDGMFSEILNGVLLRLLSDASLDINDPNVKFVKPSLRLGMIPTGSTDALVFATNGTTDVQTAAVHIILGDRLPLDVCTIHSQDRFERAAVTCVSAGFLGSTLTFSEKLRCLGPERYTFAALRALLRHKKHAFSASFASAPCASASSPHEKMMCVTDCRVCKSDHHGQISTPSSDSLSQDESSVDAPNWSTIKGSFLQVNSAVTTAAYDQAPHGLSPYNHFGSGTMDTFFVKETSRLNHVRFLASIAMKPGKQLKLPFVQAYRVSELHISHHPQNEDGAVAAWNCDGEIIEENALKLKVQRQLIDFFSRGIEPHVTNKRRFFGLPVPNTTRRRSSTCSPPLMTTPLSSLPATPAKIDCVNVKGLEDAFY